MQLTSYSARLRLLFLLVLLVFSLVTFAALFPALESLVQEGAVSHLRAAAELLSRGWDPATRSFELNRVGATGLRVTVIDRSGRVLLDTHAPARRMENHASRPEFAAALKGQSSVQRRRSRTLGEPMTYLATPLPDGALRVAISTGGVDAALARVRRIVVVGLLGAGIIGFGLVMLLTRWLARPLEALSRAVRRGEPLEPQPGWPLEIRELASDVADMRGRISEQLSELGEQHELLESMLERLENGVVMGTGTGETRLVNRAARELLVVGGEPVRQQLQKQLRAQGELKSSFHLQEPDRFLTCRSFPVSQDLRAVVMRDVSDFERLDRRRRDFVANASHELRTPLTAVATALEALELGAKDDPRQLERFLARAQKQVGRLTRLAQELLDLARAEEGRPSPGSCLLADVVRRTGEGFDELADRRGQKLSVTLPESLEGRRVGIGEEELLRALGCLVENALTYTPEGGRVEVTASLGASGVVIEVQDTGPGIPEERLERVFERFYRVEQGRSRKTGGAGLGLSIARHLVESAGGRIELENRFEGGLAARIDLQLV